MKIDWELTEKSVKFNNPVDEFNVNLTIMIKWYDLSISSNEFYDPVDYIGLVFQSRKLCSVSL